MGERRGRVSLFRVGSARLSTCVVTLVVSAGVIMANAQMASARGDANRVGCPSATEASPGFIASLPDCRAYELVSEANSGNTANVTGSYGYPEGTHVSYETFLPAPGTATHSGDEHQLFLATRTASGWQDQQISPLQGEGPKHLAQGSETNATGAIFTSDFSEAFLRSPFRDPLEDPQVNETTGMAVYGISLATGQQTLWSAPDSGVLTQSMIETQAYAGLASVQDWGEFLAGASSDGSKVFFVTTAKLATAPGTPVDTHEAGNEIYERTGGHTYLVGVLPKGEVPNCGAEVGQGVGSTLTAQSDFSYDAVASSGANVVFSTCSGLYLRDVISGSTIKLPGRYYGGRAGTGAGEEEVIFSLDSETGELYEHHVTSGENIEVGVGSLLAYSHNGSRVFYLGPEEGIYVYENGTSHLIPGTEGSEYTATFLLGGAIYNHEPTDETANMPVASAGTSNGSHLLFIDSANLTGFKTEGHQEAYVYNAEDEKMICVSCGCMSCGPSKELPSSAEEDDAQLIDRTTHNESVFQDPSPPLISADGTRVVFDTTLSLVPQDTNGTTDVYQWTMLGADRCTTASPAYREVNEGCIYLLSSGLGEEGTGVEEEKGVFDGTHLVGATEELRDIYIQNSEPLLPGLDNASHLYDVRVEGGFPYSAPVARGCEPGACKSSGGELGLVAAPGSEAVGGPGNSKPVAEHKAKKLTKKQRLSRALKSCRKKRGKKRGRCERQAHARYAKVGSSRAGRGAK
jgi:hypothetical protein